MDIENLKKIMRDAGVVGAGGAGFPSYAKLNEAADTIILNCAECEPLLKLHRQVMEKYAYEIMTALEEVADCLDVGRVIIAIKPSYAAAVSAVKAQLSSFRKIEIGFLPEVYPAGDEVVTIYETTGRVVPPNSIPIKVGVIVYNVETMLNVYRALKEDKPVTKKFVTIAGEVKNPMTVEVPLGVTYGELVELAGGTTRDDVVYFAGGPMMGFVSSPEDVVTKTSSAVLVLPKNNFVVRRHTSDTNFEFSRAKAVCCDCLMCTDMCPRHLLGHPIEPSAFMTSAVSNQTANIKPFINSMYCCGCGVCEMFACNQGLAPRSLLFVYKNGLRANGVKAPAEVPMKPVSSQRSHRLLNKERLTARLGLAPYDKAAPLTETGTFDRLTIKLSQHIGAPAEAKVKEGDKVTENMVIAATGADKLGVAIHSPINGTVEKVTDKFIVLKA